MQCIFMIVVLQCILSIVIAFVVGFIFALILPDKANYMAPVIGIFVGLAIRGVLEQGAKQ